MSKFSIGDRVRCIDASPITSLPTNLIKGRDYIIYGIKKFCCNITIDTGLPDDILSPGKHFWTCPTCKQKLDEHSNIAWRNEDRFIKVEETKQQTTIERVNVIKLTESLMISEN